MNVLTNALGHPSPSLVYTVVAAAVLAESILLIGAFVPTLTLLLTAGVLARTGQVSLPLVIAVAAAAAAAGDFLAYGTGTFLGQRLRTGRVGRRIPAALWDRVETLMTHHGGRAVFLARFLPVVRTLAPHFAGATRLPYHRIAPYSVTAVCLWATAEAGTGYTAATSLQHILTMSGPALAVIALIALGAVLLWRHIAQPARPTVSTASGGSGFPSTLVLPRCVHPTADTSGLPTCDELSTTQRKVLVCAAEASGMLTGPFGIWEDLPAGLDGTERLAWVDRQLAPLLPFVREGWIEVQHYSDARSDAFSVIPLDGLPPPSLTPPSGTRVTTRASVSAARSPDWPFDAVDGAVANACLRPRVAALRSTRAVSRPGTIVSKPATAAKEATAEVVVMTPFCRRAIPQRSTGYGPDDGQEVKEQAKPAP